jgi:uncharacterized protein
MHRAGDPVMSPDLERLVVLQQLDSAIADAKQRIAAHPQREADADARLDTARSVVDEATRRLAACQEARRALEKDAALYQSRLTKFKDQLSAVKTNREYQAMQHEIATAQQDLGTAEEKVLEQMLEADAVTEDLRQAQAALATEQQAVAREKEELGRGLARAETELAEATERRAALLDALEARLVTLYTQVARLRKGVAICAATRDGLCSVCHVRLRPHVFQQVRHNDSIVQCESCQRILYYIPPPAAATDTVSP